jgi:hypothetical protein
VRGFVIELEEKMDRLNITNDGVKLTRKDEKEIAAQARLDREFRWCSYNK